MRREGNENPRSRPAVLALQIRGDLGELGEGGLEVLNDFGGDDVGIGEVGAVFEAFVFKAEDVEVELESSALLVAAVRVALTEDASRTVKSNDWACPHFPFGLQVAAL